MRTANYTELRSNMRQYFDAVVRDSEPLLVHRGNNESVVVISLDEYNSIKETEYIMRSDAMMSILREGDAEIARGEGERIDIEDLWK